MESRLWVPAADPLPERRAVVRGMLEVPVLPHLGRVLLRRDGQGGAKRQGHEVMLSANRVQLLQNAGLEGAERHRAPARRRRRRRGQSEDAKRRDECEERQSTSSTGSHGRSIGVRRGFLETLDEGGQAGGGSATDSTTGRRRAASWSRTITWMAPA